MPPKKTTDLKSILTITKLTPKKKQEKKVQQIDGKHPQTGLGVLDDDQIDKLLNSIASHYRIQCADTFFYPYNLFTNNINYSTRFNNKYQLIRVYKKQNRVFDHGHICFSLLKKGKQYVKRNVFIKELPCIDYETYVQYINDLKKLNLCFPNFNGNLFMNYLYSYNNPSYIDILCHYLCSRVTEDGILPHFPLFYGLVNTIFDKFTYTFTDKDDYSSFKSRHKLRSGYKDKHLKIINKVDKDKVEFSDFPVCLMATEVIDFDLDEFIENTNKAYEQNGTDFNVGEYEKTMFSILFQIVISLAYIQSEWNMNHNDLHIGNVMLKVTKEKYLNYCIKGVFYRVPTFGMIVKIIDWNRGTLTYNSLPIRNNVYGCNGDCGDMYYFPSTANTKKKVIDINPSFDLALLAFEILDNDTIMDKKKSKATKLLHDWLNTDSGDNIYNMLGGKEEDPGFDLYRFIVQDCHKAVPVQQLQKNVWNIFKVVKSVIPENEKIYTI